MDDLLDDKLLNKSEIARNIGMSPVLFRMKLNGQNYNKFSSREEERINEYLTKFFKNGLEILENGNSK